MNQGFAGPFYLWFKFCCSFCIHVYYEIYMWRKDLGILLLFCNSYKHVVLCPYSSGLLATCIL